MTRAFTECCYFPYPDSHSQQRAGILTTQTWEGKKQKQKTNTHTHTHTHTHTQTERESQTKTKSDTKRRWCPFHVLESRTKAAQ